MNPKHPLFLTYYNKIIVITGSVPPSPREKALVREESNIKNSLLPGAPTQLYKKYIPTNYVGCRGVHARK